MARIVLAKLLSDHFGRLSRYLGYLLPIIIDSPSRQILSFNAAI